MMIEISAAAANREFSKLLRMVRDGETVMVTSHGEPVALMSPADTGPRPGRIAAWDRLLARLEETLPLDVTWSRDELYER